MVASSVAQKPERRPRPRREEKPRRGRSEATRVPESKRKRRTATGTIVKRMQGTDEAQEVQDEGDALFGLESAQSGVTDSYEDEVFNVSNLPEPEDYSKSDAEEDDLFSVDEP